MTAISNGSSVPNTNLSPEEVTRYSRHIIMSQVGPAGQRKLKNSRVLVVGAGGLGGPVSIYLALAGVGTIGIVEFDVVDLSNLQRQVLHQTADIDRPKIQSAKETLSAYNPHVSVIEHHAPITSDNAMEIIADYDIVVNGADNTALATLFTSSKVTESILASPSLTVSSSPVATSARPNVAIRAELSSPANTRLPARCPRARSTSS